MRFAEENTDIDEWLAALKVVMPKDADLARELAELPRLRKGYGETRSSGVCKYARVMAQVVAPWLTNSLPPDATTTLKSLRQQALSDSDGSKFNRLLEMSAAANSSSEKVAAE